MSEPLTYKTIRRSVKHDFTPDEISNLSTEFQQAYDDIKVIGAEFDNVKQTYKAKTTEAESKMERLSALLHAKFELREKPLAMIYDVKNGKKYFFLETDIVDGVFIEGARPLLVEPMTDADRQQELLESESKFEVQEDIALFNAAEGDQAILTVGRYNNMWYSALRVKVGAKTIVQRLDSEQPSSKKRSDQINRACATFVEWVDKNFDRESAKGFKNAVELVKTEHAERAE